MKRILAILTFTFLGGIIGLATAVGLGCNEWLGVALIISGILVGCLIGAALVGMENDFNDRTLRQPPGETGADNKQPRQNAANPEQNRK